MCEHKGDTVKGNFEFPFFFISKTVNKKYIVPKQNIMRTRNTKIRKQQRRNRRHSRRRRLQTFSKKQRGGREIQQEMRYYGHLSEEPYEVVQHTITFEFYGNIKLNEVATSYMNNYNENKSDDKKVNSVYFELDGKRIDGTQTYNQIFAEEMSDDYPMYYNPEPLPPKKQLLLVCEFRNSRPLIRKIMVHYDEDHPFPTRDMVTDWDDKDVLNESFYLDDKNKPLGAIANELLEIDKKEKKALKDYDITVAAFCIKHDYDYDRLSGELPYNQLTREQKKKLILVYGV